MVVDKANNKSSFYFTYFLNHNGVKHNFKIILHIRKVLLLFCFKFAETEG